MAEKKEPVYTPPHMAPNHTQAPVEAPAKPRKLRTTFQDKKIVATRSSRQGDDGYQLSTVNEQVTIIFEDGSEKVVTRDDLFEPVVV